MQNSTPHGAARRTVLHGAAVAGLGLTAAACSDDPDDSATPTAPVSLGSSGSVPVGGAKLYREEKLVVAQPAEGDFRAFSAVCTHKGCVLSSVERTEGHCACHGSRFDVTSGEVLQGPATKPLPKVPVRAKGGELTAGPQD
ncbi:Rieske (2Fe-2S) protein [Streptomyces sp. N2-109]|uniref:Cytochrome bc1 complex Rieske iron-sulfur subunit n=1 Tax=Streptomyces gossypii TaxID=2883101 RepID=A0ABT2K137_9ACTN|nr:Rieske (2Fe-2S) protein [Streptomyces gossypii]MCT2593882.1 Rieske (2Fe-2S) protein [Streptomyces gossypii]